MDVKKINLMAQARRAQGIASEEAKEFLTLQSETVVQNLKKQDRKAYRVAVELQGLNLSYETIEFITGIKLDVNPDDLIEETSTLESTVTEAPAPKKPVKSSRKGKI